MSGTGEINVSIQEIKEPEGYKKDEKLKEFKFTRDEETGEITLDTNSLKNIEQKNIKINEQTDKKTKGTMLRKTRIMICSLPLLKDRYAERFLCLITAIHLLSSEFSYR